MCMYIYICIYQYVKYMCISIYIYIRIYIYMCVFKQHDQTLMLRIPSQQGSAGLAAAVRVSVARPLAMTSDEQCR